MGNISGYFVGLPGGLLMSVIAFSIVFLVIVGLMLMMFALKSVVGVINRSAESANQAPAVSATATAPKAAAVSGVSGEDDSELLAVITAAIAAVCGAGARVVSFTQAPERTPGTPWRMAGRLQNSEGFLD